MYRDAGLIEISYNNRQAVTLLEQAVKAGLPVLMEVCIYM